MFRFRCQEKVFKQTKGKWHESAEGIKVQRMIEHKTEYED